MIALRLIVVISILALTGCDSTPKKPAPKCLRSHNETVWVQDPPVYVKAGGVYIPVQSPPRQEVRTVCDEWEPSTRND